MAIKVFNFEVVLATMWTGDQVPEYVEKAIKRIDGVQDVIKNGNEVGVRFYKESARIHLSETMRVAIKDLLAVGYPAAYVKLEPDNLGLTFSQDDLNKSLYRAMEHFNHWERKMNRKNRQKAAVDG